jgi:flagellar hook assembly protein FlgD
LDKAANVSVAIYNVAGAQIMNLNEGLKSVGNHNMTINANNLPAGVYYYTLTADNYSVTKKMIVY